jgi:putative copper export protein
MSDLVLGSLQRFALQGGTLLLVGVAAWKVFVHGRSAVPQTAGTASMAMSPVVDAVERRVVHVARIAVLGLLGVWGLRFYVQLSAFRDRFAPLSEDVSFLLKETFWGTVWLGQGLLLFLLTTVVLLLARRPAEPHPSAGASASSLRRVDLLWVAYVGGAVLLALSLALSSHALSAEGSRTLAVAADAMHTLAAGSWIGSLALLLMAHRKAGDEGGALFAAHLRAFSPMAMVAVTTLVLMGLYLSWQYLSSPADLWRSTYGRILSLKVMFVGFVLLMGFLNWRRGIPALDTPAGRSATRNRALWEVGVAVVVLVLTGVLTGSPKP